MNVVVQGVTTSWSRRRSAALVAVFLIGVASPAAADPTPDVAYPDDPELQRAYESGFYRGADAGYRDGRDEGYEDGHRAGLSEGESKGRREALAEADEADLRDDVEQEVEEGGADLGTELTPSPSPSATPSPTTVSMPDDDEDSGPGFPWWPVSFAAVASVWFVTRRRRPDPEGGADSSG